MRQHGLIFGVSFNGWTIGCAIGPLVAGYLFDVSHSYHVAFLICAVSAIVGLALTTSLAPVGEETSFLLGRAPSLHAE